MTAPATLAAPWMHSASGRRVPLVNTPVEAISIRDIAAHLSKICRFAGATQVFYSVAQHSVLVSNLMAEYGPHAQMYGLLHDAHEAYIGDIPQPVKDLLNRSLGLGGEWLPLYDLTGDLDRAIHTRAGLVWPPQPATCKAIRHADLRALATEKRDLMAEGPSWGADLPAPWRASIKPQNWLKAEEKFLELYDDLAAMTGAQVAA
jgi:hypothetical protein